jgi:hypothetical protein
MYIFIARMEAFNRYRSVSLADVGEKGQNHTIVPGRRKL